MRPGLWAPLVALCVPALVSAQSATPSPRVLEFRFTPTARAQIALWLEKADGTFVKTVFLTQAVGLRGIGNRPGASGMNSGFHWPYGRREGALPLWAHRRAAAPGAAQFNRVIFQNRLSEGFASRTSEDSTSEAYFCLSFNNSTTKKDALDAVTCASGFNSDKGRYMKAADVTNSYNEPGDGPTDIRLLDSVSLYPPRRDVNRCTAAGCPDTPDVSSYGDHARQVMPDIDSVTMATPVGGDQEQSFLVAVPADLPDGDYLAWAEVNTEGDSNASFNLPTAQGSGWDSWATDYGYAYRGQPSVAFKVPIKIGMAGSYSVTEPVGYGDVHGFGPDGGRLYPMDAKISDNPTTAPGSGADRFRLMAGTDYRLKVVVRGGPGPSGSGGSSGAGGAGAAGAGGGAGGAAGGTDMPGSGGSGEVDNCSPPPEPPLMPTDVRITPVGDPKHSHEWGHLHFVVSPSQARIHDYEVRVSEEPITTSDPKSFTEGRQANIAAVEDGMLVVPKDGTPGSSVDVDFGHLNPDTTYFVAVRAKNDCAQVSDYVVGSFTTSRINFTKLSGCFVATAAFGSAMEPQVESLRQARDALRTRSELFAAATDLYYRSGPVAAAVISRSDSLRALARTLLAPVVTAAQLTDSPRNARASAASGSSPGRRGNAPPRAGGPARGPRAAPASR